MVGGNQAFQVYTHLLFSNRKRLADEPYDEFAKEVGLDLNKFRALNKPGSPADEKVKKDIEEGNRLRLNATPQIFFLNKKLPENYRGSFLVHLLEDLIREYRPEAGEVKLYLPGP
jgi:protein-disulfide isomerase